MIDRRFAGWLFPLWMSLCLLSTSALAQKADPDFGAATMVETTAGSLAVYQAGQGKRTLVFWPSVFADHTLYRAQAQALRNEVRMIFIDGPGHGDSGPQAEGATIATHANAVSQILETLHVARAEFVGTSWGGLVGAHLARQRPGLLDRLFILSAPLETRADGPSFSDRMKVWGACVFGSFSFFVDGVADSMMAPRAKQLVPDAVAEFKSRLSGFKQCQVAAVARTVVLERENTVPWLGEIKVPTVVVAGKADVNLQLSDVHRWATLIPGASLVEFDSGHLPTIEVPEQVNALLRAAPNL